MNQYLLASILFITSPAVNQPIDAPGPIIHALEIASRTDFAQTHDLTDLIYKSLSAIPGHCKTTQIPTIGNFMDYSGQPPYCPIDLPKYR